MQIFCLKCKAHRDVNEPEQVKMKNGKPATKGKCAVCGTSVYRIGAST